MSLKAMLFDLGLTLTKTDSFPEIYRKILARFGITPLLNDIILAQNATESEFNTETYDENQRKEFWTNYNTSLLKKLGIKKDVVFLAAQIDELWWEFSHLQVYPDVEPTLSRLRDKGLKLGLVTNSFKQDLDYVLGELRLEKWFDAIACIDSCNCTKPNKEIFLHALNKLGVKPRESLFIGDSVVYDYEGALNVGIKPLLIDREGIIPNRYDKISSLTELLIIV
jgi:putative hydrolase of the HAD superfamily